VACCETDPEVGEDKAEDARCAASRALRRLVGFVASAFDVRFAFVVAFDAPADPRRVGLWLARDYGLRSEYAQMETAKGTTEEASPAFGRLFQRVWPHEPELAEIRPGGCISLPVLDTVGGLAGHLGILDPERSCQFSARERLAPLARRAAIEAQRWRIGPTL
jgi:hypothetical protein